MIDVSTLSLDEIKRLYPIVSLYNAESVLATGAKTMGDLWRIQSEMFARLKVEDPGFIERDRAEIEKDLDAVRLGAKGGAAGRGAAKRRDVDYRKLGAMGGRPGPSLAAQAMVVWTELTTDAPSKMTLGPRLAAHMLKQAREPQIGLTPESAARLVRERAGTRTSAWITKDARILGEP